MVQSEEQLRNTSGLSGDHVTQFTGHCGWVQYRVGKYPELFIVFIAYVFDTRAATIIIIIILILNLSYSFYIS